MSRINAAAQTATAGKDADTNKKRRKAEEEVRRTQQECDLI